MASYRHLARIAVMQTLFAYEFRDEVNPDEMLQYCAAHFESKLKELDFARELLKGVLQFHGEIYDLMRQNAPEWPVERIARIDRAILAIGIYEIIFSKDVPQVVAINEGVEMAKEYGDMNSAKFINGVLSAVMNKHKKNNKDAEREV